MSERNDMNLTPEERRIQESLRGLGEVRADEAFRAKLRQQFLSGQIAGTAADAAAIADDKPPQVRELPRRARRPRRRLALAAFPAIAAALFVIFLSGKDIAWQLEDVRGTGNVTVNGQTAASTDRDAVAGLIVPEARISVPEGLQLDVVLDDVLVLGVAGPADFTLPANPDQEPYVYQATIHDGEFRIKTGPKFSSRKVLLLTTEGRVEITGTSVAVFKNAEVTCVCVLEGTAMIGRDRDHLDAIGGGMRKVMFVDGRDPLIIPIEPGHKEGLLEFESYNQDIFK